MSKLHFYKFDGAGNDFVIIDIRRRDPRLTTDRSNISAIAVSA